MQTTHQIHFGLSQQMSLVQDQSVALVVTSPPYPMIEMWDESMSQQNPAISEALLNQQADLAFELMHQTLDLVWAEVARVTSSGGFVCINIGDATRTIDGNFQLFSNHTRIIRFFLQQNFQNRERKRNKTRKCLFLGRA